ncbi:LysR substrate-binding domain-containing protein [Propionivibrio sp.]|uniref:LysR substrate-binding domain-containing protein n=1 Tax=Propionivibrio sp. TaxID=2212460 RepID=UPI003BF13122
MPDGPLAANSPILQRHLAVHGMGIVGLTDRFAGQWVDQGLLKRVLPEWQLPTVTVWCVTHGRRLLPARTLAFIEMLRSALASAGK